MKTRQQDLKKLLIITLVTLLTLPAFADKGEGKRGKGKGKFAQILKEMNLTEEQLEKIKAHRKENKGKMKPLREEAKTLREELGKAFVNGASDGEINSLNSRLQQNRSKMSDMKISKMIFFKNLLNAEQRKIWHEKKKSWKGKRGKRHGKRD